MQYQGQYLEFMVQFALLFKALLVKLQLINFFLQFKPLADVQSRSRW